jgi:uncharacterized 2Fe-2S/4Fe-4S cluster protein (DUF4445 family)
MRSPTVIFQPSGRRGRVDSGATLREAAQKIGVEIESVCGGKGTCGKCKVVIHEGFFEKYGINSSLSNLSPLTESEREHLKKKEIASNYRLACAARVEGDVLVYVPEESRGGGQVIRKAAGRLDVPLNPAIRKYYVELEPPTLDNSEGDLERLLQGLEEAHGLRDLRMDYPAAREMPNVLRRGAWKVTVTVWQDREITWLEPGSSMRRLGLAVDIGTTTVVGYLTDLETGEVVEVESMMNPQVPYGEDVMSRITYSMTHPHGLEEMNKAIVQGLNKIVRRVTEKAGAEPSDVLELTVVGNTCMHHLFLNMNPEYLGLSPFTPAIQKSIDLKARDLGLRVNPGANVHLLPIEAGFVGADNMGVIVATQPHRQDKILLIIDIGTNGEIVLGNKHKLLSTSCATGPAFEGAQIKFGMRAAPGAIERVRIEPGSWEVDYEVIGDGKARGICGSGIIEAVAEMFKTGIIRKNGNFNPGVDSDRLRKNGKGQYEYVLAWAQDTAINRDIAVTLGDIRAIQLAKGALYTGCKILMKRYGVESVDRVILAGAFGNYIDKEASMLIGMFPDCDLEKVVAVGNAAGDGARAALLNRDLRREAEEVARKIEYVELTVDKEFQKEFMMAMHFPHMRDEFPHIQGILDEIPR